MRDIEGNTIKICSIPNPNILIWGRSGQGKSYCCCRRIEEAVQEGKQVLIIDYSGSYTEDQLRKNRSNILAKIEIINVRQTSFSWMPPYETEEELVSNLSDVLVEVLKVESYFQKKWMCKAVGMHMENDKYFNMPQFVATLENLYNILKAQEAEKDDLENIKRLLTRCSPYEKIKNFYIQRRIEKKEHHYPVTVLQLSDFSEHEKKFLTNIIISCLWKEAFHGLRRCDVLVLDEIHFLSIKNGGAFHNMLREGRKFGLELMLSTQFLGHYKKEALASLLQAGNLLIFKPDASDLKFSASIVDPQNVKQWLNLLDGLDIGEAVLKGNYTLNHGDTRITDPIICKI